MKNKQYVKYLYICMGRMENVKYQSLTRCREQKYDRDVGNETIEYGGREFSYFLERIKKSPMQCKFVHK